VLLYDVVTCHGAVHFGLVWCDAVWCGVVRRGAVHCGGVKVAVSLLLLLFGTYVLRGLEDETVVDQSSRSAEKLAVRSHHPCYT
jgi:hypothetical protein